MMQYRIEKQNSDRSSTLDSSAAFCSRSRHDVFNIETSALFLEERVQTCFFPWRYEQHSERQISGRKL